MKWYSKMLKRGKKRKKPRGAEDKTHSGLKHSAPNPHTGQGPL